MKFISSSYNKETGEATVIMQHLGVKFEGTAKVHPDELDRASEYAGCSYAETRATIKALKYERKIAKDEAEACRKFVKAVECYSKFNPEDESAKSIYKQLGIKINKVNELTETINSLMLGLNMNIHRRKIVLNAIDQKKSKEDNISG